MMGVYMQSLSYSGGFLNLKNIGLKFIFCLLVSFVVSSMVLDQVRVIYSPTDSLPYRFFLELKNIKPVSGQYAYFENPWYGGRVIKKIGGREGDVLSYDNEGCLWVGPQQIGKAKSRSRDGRGLTPIRAGKIPKGMVFVRGEHERSFDSRYEQMGLVPEYILSGRVLGIM